MRLVTENIPVQVATINLTKENYLHWYATITIGITGHGRIGYVNGKKKQPSKNDLMWTTWYLEDNHIKTWIVDSISTDI